MKRRAWFLVAAWALAAGAAAGQPTPQVQSAPFTILPRIEGLGARASAQPVSVTLVTSSLESPDGVEVLRLVPSGQRWPAWRLDAKTTMAPGESRAVVDGLPGERVLLVLAGSAPGYRLEGPFTWPAREGVRVVAPLLRRTLVGGLPGGDLPNPQFTWVRGARLPEAGPWPACGLLAPDRWECIGVPLDEPGVLLLSTGPPVRFGVAAVPEKEPMSVQTASVRSADWCRLLRIAAAATPPTSLLPLEVTPSRDRQGRAGRTERAADDRVSVDRLGDGAFWVCGDSELEGGVLHIEGDQVATTDVAFDGWHRGPPELAHELKLDPPVRAVAGVEDVKENPAGGTSVIVPENRLRGRVVRDGRPMANVLVGLTPDLAAYAAGADPMELVTFSGLSDATGRFEVAVPPEGAGVLRVGDEATGIVRVLLGTTDRLPAVLDLGDIELPPPVRLIVDVDGPAGCALGAVGPLGSSGMTIVKSQPAPDGAYLFHVPESGRWALTLTCGGREIPLVPAIVEVPPHQTEVRVRVAARVGG